MNTTTMKISDAAVARLKESKEESDAEAAVGGFEAGFKWAEDKAEFFQLEVLRRAKENLDEGHDDCCVADLVATKVLEHDGSVSGNDKDEFWSLVADLSLEEVSDAFATAFLNGAVEVLEQAESSSL